MFLGWAWCFAAAGVWNRLLTWLTAATCGSLAVGSVGLLLPEGMRPGPLLVAISNGPGFLLLELWLVLVTEQVLRRARPDELHGRLIGIVAQSRLVRAYAEWVRVPAFRSGFTAEQRSGVSGRGSE